LPFAVISTPPTAGTPDGTERTIGTWHFQGLHRGGSLSSSFQARNLRSPSAVGQSPSPTKWTLRTPLLLFLISAFPFFLSAWFFLLPSDFPVQLDPLQVVQRDLVEPVLKHPPGRTADFPCQLVDVLVQFNGGARYDPGLFLGCCCWHLFSLACLNVLHHLFKHAVCFRLVLVAC